MTNSSFQPGEEEFEDVTGHGFRVPADTEDQDEVAAHGYRVPADTEDEDDRDGETR